MYFLFNNKKAFTKGVFAALQNEIFVNMGNTANVNGKFFDQNRLYLALGYRLRSAFDLEAGYLNQYISGRNKTFTNNHVLQVAGYLRLWSRLPLFSFKILFANLQTRLIA